MNKIINLFFLKDGSYECIVTTRDKIKNKYDRKISVELEEAKTWTKGICCSVEGGERIEKHSLTKFNDEDYFYINANSWIYDKKDHPIYQAIEKKFANGGEYYTLNLQLGMSTACMSSCMAFLFTE